jgi:hypothetical protein
MGQRGVLPRGTLLRGYEMKSVLGHGAFGITYRARDTTLNRDVAIKEYLPGTLALREGRTTVLPLSPDHAEQFAWGCQRFLEEARTLARLDGTPGIVRVFDFLEANGTAYMVMALVEGETLAKRLMREKRLAPEAVERLLNPLLDGLEAFHAATFLHRDIKPANIMVDGKGKPTLIDFGASRAAMADRSTTMTAIFTPGYAAAEQFVATSKLGPWTDIYGLSATLYHAITGNIPPSAFERIMKDDYVPLERLQPEGYAPALLAGIDAGLAIRADERPQTIAEWRGMLDLASISPGQQATRVVRKPGRLARAANRSRRARYTVRGPVLWGTVAAMVLLVSGAGYFAFQAGSGGNAAYNLTAEQLEQALSERRKADALAAEKKRLVEEAQRKADADAEAKIRADNELEQARQARQKAEQELAQVKAEIEARRQQDTGQRDQQAAAERRAAEEAAQRKAEADAAALRQAEEEAQKKVAAEAEAKRQADEALAKAEAEKKQADEQAAKVAAAEQAKVKADEEARLKAEAAAKAKGDAEALQKVAEANERALRLEPVDRQRLQVALTSLGFDTRGSDGVFGPRSREMIAGWQKSRNESTTGFVSAPQQQALLKQAAEAVGKFDDDQKKIEDEKKAADEARTRAVAVAPAAAPPATGGSPTTSADGLWRGIFDCRVPNGGQIFISRPELKLTNGSGSWTPPSGSDDGIISFRLTIDGPNVNGYVARMGRGADSSMRLFGRIDGDTIRASGAAALTCTLSLTRDPASVQTASSAYDGTYTLSTYTGGGSNLVTFTLRVTKGSGRLAINRAGCSDSQFDVTISPAGEVSGQGDLKCVVQVPSPQTSSLAGSLAITGRIADRRATLRLSSSRADYTFALSLSAN